MISALYPALENKNDSLHELESQSDLHNVQPNDKGETEQTNYVAVYGENHSLILTVQ